MPTWGSVDFENLKRLEAKIKRLEEAGVDAFAEKAVKMLAARFLSKVIKRTPVGEYAADKKGNTRVGGTLRRGWTAKSNREAELSATFGGNDAPGAFVRDLKVVKKGSSYEVTIENVVEYAAYVEFGHRLRGGKGFVPGRFFMTISANEVQDLSAKLLQREVDKLLKDVFK